MLRARLNGTGKAPRLSQGSGGGGPVVNNPFVKSLITGRTGTNGATSYLDERGFTWSAGNTATMSNVSPLYAPTSMLLPDTASSTNFNTGSGNSAAFNLGAGDFAVEAWFNTAQSEFVIVDHGGQGVSNGWRMACTEGALLYWYSDTAGYFPLNIPGGITTGTHYAKMERISGTTRGYWDTTLLGSFADTTNYNVSVATYIGRAGNDGTLRPLQGQLGGLAITIGASQGGTPVTVPSPYKYLT